MDEFDWGSITPEMYDDANQTAWHVINANLVGDANKERTLRFVCARILYFDKKLPSGCKQHVRLDLRGQMVSNIKLNQVRRTIVDASADKGILVVVDFLTS